MSGERRAGSLTEQGAEELALEDFDDSVQRLVQLVVFLPQTLSDTILILVSVLEFGPVLLQEFQGPLGIFKIKKNNDIFHPSIHPTGTFRLQNSQL